MVTIVANKEGKVVTPYQGNPEFGFIVLKSTEIVNQNGWLAEKERSTIMRGKTEMLGRYYTAGQNIPGKIVVHECTEESIPAHLASQLDKNLGFEEQISKFLKRAGSEDAPVLLSEGRRILRFATYDASGTMQDIRVQHDNVAEIKAFNLATTAEAQLPG